jgi:hypothetical protein
MSLTLTPSEAHRLKLILRWRIERDRMLREMREEREILRRERIEAAAKAKHGNGGRLIVLACECEPGQTRSHKRGTNKTDGLRWSEASPAQEDAIRALEDCA